MQFPVCFKNTSLQNTQHGYMVTLVASAHHTQNTCIQTVVAAACHMQHTCNLTFVATAQHTNSTGTMCMCVYLTHIQVFQHLLLCEAGPFSPHHNQQRPLSPLGVRGSNHCRFCYLQHIKKVMPLSGRWRIKGRLKVQCSRGRSVHLG